MIDYLKPSEFSATRRQTRARFATLPVRLMLLGILASALFQGGLARAAEEGHKHPWWDAKWPTRKKIVVDTSAKGVAIADPIGTTPILIRLHDGNFNFMGAREDGSDLRFVTDDNKTVLPHHVEKWDSLLNEAYVWVSVPEVKPGTESTLWLYSGNVTDAASIEDAKGSFDADTVAVYHFGDAATVAKDSSANQIGLEGTSPPGPGIIGNGHRLLGQAAVTIPATPATAWVPGGSFTLSTWLKAGAAQPNAILFSRRDGANAVLVGVDNSIPFIEVNRQRTTGNSEIAPAVWHHLAVTFSGGTAALFVDGSQVATLNASLPGMQGPIQIGKDSTGNATGFVGDIDEVHLAKTARPAGFIKFADISQGTSNDTGKLVAVSADELSEAGEEGELMKHISLLSDISKNLTPDGWAVIFLCTVLAVVGWGIAIGKFFYLNKISKATAAFLDRWERMSSDLTSLDSGDSESIKTMGGAAEGKKAQRLMHQSPLYHIYHLGCNEIQQRVKNVRQISLSSQEKFVQGLSGRSIQAIKATLHGGLMREVQKLNGKLVFLTIGIAGGPYLGLLGTVIGVMITFAVIAKSGQVEVNSIAPGIAGALLATVAGLAVAIPALFAYSYLSSRIKDAVTDMETFIDEFVAKMAEHYKE